MEKLLVFAKFWFPGHVKSRLGQTIGNVAAAKIYRQFVETLTTRFLDMADERTLVVELGMDANQSVCDERTADFIRLAGPNWKIRHQSQGNLGTRMAHALDQAFTDSSPVSHESHRVVVIGSDAPTLPQYIVSEAFQALKQRDVVLGPSADGGYYLVGARQAVPPIFADIDWSTDQVWNQTCVKLQQSANSWHVLPEWYDIDEIADLHRLLDELEHLPSDEKRPELIRLQHIVRQAVYQR